MKIETKYSYQQRIKELEEENNKLRAELMCYRDTVKEIFDGVVSMVKANTSICRGWILERMKRCLK